MPFDERLAGRIRAVLATRDAVVEKRMFGGICFLINGSMCCGVVKQDLCARVGPLRYEEALKQAHARPMDFTGRPLKGFVFVAPRGLRSDAALERWVSWAADFAMTQARKKKRASGRVAPGSKLSSTFVSALAKRTPSRSMS